MVITTLLGLFAGLFAYLARYKITGWGLKASFILIFLFLALRYNYGNDYNTYLTAFEDISQYDLFDFSDNKYNFETAWIFLNQLCRPIGFFGMTVLLALFNCIVYYRYIAKYVPLQYYWVAVYLYVFSPEFMLIQLSAMRQSIAIALFVVSLDFLYKKEPIRYLICIALASLFHTSAIILLPVYLLGFYNSKLNRVIGILFVTMFGYMILFGGSFSLYVKELISVYFEKYDVYQNPGAVNTGLGFAYAAGMLVLTTYYGRLENRETALTLKIAAVNFVLMPLNLMIELIARFGFYFAPATMVAYPIIFKNFKSPLNRTLLLALILIFTALKYYLFNLYSENRDYYYNYQTLFSAPEWY